MKRPAEKQAFIIFQRDFNGISYFSLEKIYLMYRMI